MNLRIALAAWGLAASGCATVLNDSTQSIRLETLTDGGQLVNGADCTLTNDYGALTVKSGSSVKVRRSSQDLYIACHAPDQPDAMGLAISRVNGGMFGNIILGGGIGAIIDHSKGTAYTYPTWIKLVFGKTLTFDRRSEAEGQPVLGVEAAASAASAPAPAPASAPAPAPATPASAPTAAP